MQKLIDIFSMGGPVMIPLAGLGFVGAIIFLERLLYLHKGQIRAVEFVSGIKTALLNIEQPRDVMAQSVAVAAQNEFALIDRRVASVALVAKVAPLLGLLGTVVALLQSFYTMSKSGSYATAAEFSGYVYAALLSTAFGLLISISGWLAYSFLNSRVRALAHDIDLSANEILLFINRGMPENENLHLKGKDAK